MKIVIFNENWLYGGSNLYIENLIKFASDDNHDVEFILNNEGKYNKDVIPKIVKISRFNTFNIVNSININHQKNKLLRNLFKFFYILNPFIFFINIFRFYFLLKKKKPDLVISCNGGYPAAESCISIVVSSYFLNIKSIFSIASMPRKRKIILYPYELLLDKYINLTANIIMTYSIKQMKSLEYDRGIFNQNNKVLNNGIESNPVINKNYGVIKKLGVISRIDSDKSISTLIYLAEKLKKNNVNVHLYIVGSGPEIEDVKRLALNLNLINDVTFTGYVNDIHKYLLDFDLYVFPSLLEGLPYSILEAMKYGLPIITTPAGGITEAITNLENGIIVEMKSVESFFQATKLLVDDTKLAEKLGKNAQKSFRKKFTNEVMHYNFSRIINTLK